MRFPSSAGSVGSRNIGQQRATITTLTPRTSAGTCQVSLVTAHARARLDHALSTRSRSTSRDSIAEESPAAPISRCYNRSPFWLDATPRHSRVRVARAVPGRYSQVSMAVPRLPYRIFSQAPEGAVDPAALVRAATRFFEADLDVLALRDRRSEEPPVEGQELRVRLESKRQIGRAAW